MPTATLYFGSTTMSECFQSSVNPRYSVTVYSDIQYELRNTGYHFHLTGNPKTSMSRAELVIAAGFDVSSELRGIANFATWGKNDA